MRVGSRVIFASGAAVGVLAVIGAAWNQALLAAAELEYQSNLPVSHPAIQYFASPAHDRVARLAQDIRSGKVILASRTGAVGYLPSLLQALDVSVDSQALVFSKTSFQSAKISPRTPRAIYFDDDVAVGFVPGGDGFELAALDPTQGIIFYTLDVPQPDHPVLTRREVCLKCHQGPATLGVPGIFVGSVYPNAAGTPDRSGAIVTDHRTPFADRWGGWYVNAARGQQLDRSNAIAPNPADPDVLDTEGKQNLTGPAGRFNPANYLSPVSDIVALMTFEHQTQMINFFTRLGWEARIAERDQPASRAAQNQIDATIEALLGYLLFLDEARLKEPLQGVSSFTKTFPQRGPRDSLGRSLRDFDLHTRLFRYPLSYMIYSPAFDALPTPVRDRIYKRLYEVLTGQDRSPRFVGLSDGDRSSLLQILRETKSTLPGYWRNSSRVQ